MPYTPDILKRLGIRKEAPSLSFTPQSERLLHDIVLAEAESGSFELIPFIATGETNNITSIYSTFPDVCRRTIHIPNEYSLTVSPGTEIMENLFYVVQQDEKLDQIKIFGYVSPMGSINYMGQELTIPQTEGLLYPGLDQIRTFGKLLQLNPHLHIPHFALAAKTQEIPKVRIWPTEPLLKAKRYKHIDRVPYQTINLSDHNLLIE
jgi:hypothetical protein